MRGPLLRFAGRSFRLLIGAFLLWCGGALLVPGIDGLRAELRFEDEALPITGEVTGKSISRATGDRGTQYEIAYVAEVPGVGRVKRTAAVDVAEWEGLHAGRSLELQVVPGDLGSMRLARPPAIARQAVPIAIGGVLTPVGLGLFIAGARDVRRKLRLYRHGVPAEATVLAVEPTNVRVNKKPQWRIRFRYRDRVGQEREGVSDYMSSSNAQAWNPGDTGVVHVDPASSDGVLWMDTRRDPS